jgi:CRP-like cAMP-binding protein
MLGVLPAATIEQLGAGLERAEFAPREVVFEQGAAGDRFYVVESGRAEVVCDGRVVNTLERGDGFGEIALLGDRPRTATVRAAGDDEPLRVGILQRPAFLTAVTGYPVSATAGQEVLALAATRDAERLAAASHSRVPLSATAEGSVGRGRRPSPAEDVRQAPPDHAERAADAPGP